MVWVGLTSKGATKPYFIDPKDTVNSIYYIRRILPHVKIEGKRILDTKKLVKIKQNKCIIEFGIIFFC